MRDAVGLGEQHAQHAELRFIQSQGPDAIFEHGGHAPTDVLKEPAEHDAGHREVRHAFAQPFQVGLHPFNLERHNNRLTTNHSVDNSLSKEYNFRNYY